ncbi:MAG: 1-deoxy-D-xylulose-5-phosphate reductoisomerase, partial [bacterium]
MKRLSVLGSTGSIGTSTLDVVRRFTDRFRITALAAGRNVDRLAEQVREFQPSLVSVPGDEERDSLLNEIGTTGVRVVTGQEGLKEAACIDADLVVAAISGSSGLLPTYWAIDSGHDVALANKESLVMAGGIVTRLAGEREVTILPVDSEHSAVFHCLEGRRMEDVSRIILTASGGPFREYTRAQMEGLTPEMALDHPVWQMGKKVTIDSSTMMNKGLEVIEARWLFDVPATMISVLVHAESIIHSMVEYKDGSIMALLSIPDMRLPIMKALGFPESLPCDWGALDLVKAGPLTFAEPDQVRFPCLGLAYQAIEGEESLPVVLNAANEVAVEAFCARRIPYLSIPEVIKRCLDKHLPQSIQRIEDALEVHAWARNAAQRMI